MGIDARLVIKYHGEKPTTDQLTRWSWDLCRAVGAKHFFISDGLPHPEYSKASKAWHAAFKAHALHSQFDAVRNGDRDEWQRIRGLIVADIGEAPKQLRRAVDLTCENYDADDFSDDEDIPKSHRKPGMVYTQDGDPVLAAPGEWLLDVSLWTRFYGVGYEHGDLLTICAVAEWIEVNMHPCEVWYGGDSSGCCIERFNDAARRKLRAHLFSDQGRDYFNYSGWGGPTPPMPKPCGLCVPGEERRNQYGSGMNGNFAAVSCAGCGKNFETHDRGVTWVERKED